ncbi:hypothetical protein [Candidatus Caldatribacterium saccharofermentans]|uniref:MFS transporter n=1 Tax=Candidatus Caldatribacterium saccharofermentans TaxID=1454753 RepID=A0A7V4TKE3_9BACT
MERKVLAQRVFLVAFICLAGEMVLFRLLAFLFGHHFVSLPVALATLGYGASGTLYPLLSERFRRFIFPLFGLSLLASAAVFLFLPLDVYQFFVHPLQWVYLGGLLFVVFFPFFFHGLLQVTAFELFPEFFPSLYALNFVGSALGVGGAFLLLFVLDELRALFALLVLLTFAGNRGKKRLFALCFLPFLFLPLQPFLSPYAPSRAITALPDTYLLGVYRNPAEYLEVFASPHARFGLGLSPLFQRLPPESFILIHDHVTTAYFPQRVDSDFLEHLLMSLPFQAFRPGRALVVEERDGLAVYAAWAAGVQAVDFITKSSLFSTFLKEHVPFFPARVHVGLPRKFIAARRAFWDMVVLRVPVGRATVFPGGFSFEENFLLTVEGVRDLFQALDARGVVVFSFFLQNPPSVLPKLVLLLREVLGEELRERLLVVKSLDFALLLVKKTPWTRDDLENVFSLVRKYAFDFVYGPWNEEEMEKVFHTGKRYYRAVCAALEGKGSKLFDLRPPQDSRPYFGNFLRLSALAEALKEVGKRWLPFGGAGFLVVLFTLAVMGGFSGFFILLPCFFRKRPPSRYRFRLSLGGVLTGVGFMFVEIPLIVYLHMLLGFPLYAFSLLLGALLLFSGLGSFFVFCKGTAFPRFLLLSHAAVLLGCFLGLFGLRETLLGFSSLGSLCVVLPILALVGWFLGFPFPLLSQGIQHTAPHLFGEVFAWNGFFSVFSSLLAHLVSLFWGLWIALFFAILAYLAFSLLLYPFFPGEGNKANRS